MDKRTAIIGFLESISESLQLLEDDFYLIGSGALVMERIEIDKVNDIDLLTSERDADKLKKIWNDKLSQGYIPADGQLFKSNFGRFRFNTFDLEVMGDLAVNTQNGWHNLRINEYLTVNIAGLSLRIPTLLEQYRVFKLFGRPKDLHKAQLIKNSDQ
ncbi:nucleotidyltransferase family protein [Solitalea canadensis]|uniref:Uncharacterized protein n=1 Tax=Solitalea canadensis (strain ATCC 29591 / DSM 3403 / JCM 21819 / LMG 8368 / NBRC 15130 / NCIMB 12057 / USAM 9D) TaxID=929556 RepID=H8KXV2_SOLCM|nr:hypothetical protein [Solitalea canadensis]AFD05628.1 hypothetical protein Solca_0496 [Solitalea canadensis DSM 3403]